MQTPYVETDCTFTHNGHTFESGGAIVTEDRATAYLKNGENVQGTDPRHYHNANSKYPAYIPGSQHNTPGVGTLTDWHGNPIGTYTVKSRIHSRTYGGCDPMYSIVARINGRRYHGRTQGPGMYVNLRAYKHQ